MNPTLGLSFVQSSRWNSISPFPLALQQFDTFMVSSCAQYFWSWPDIHSSGNGSTYWCWFEYLYAGKVSGNGKRERKKVSKSLEQGRGWKCIVTVGHHQWNSGLSDQIERMMATLYWRSSKNVLSIRGKRGRRLGNSRRHVRNSYFSFGETGMYQEVTRSVDLIKL